MENQLTSFNLYKIGVPEKENRGVAEGVIEDDFPARKQVIELYRESLPSAQQYK